MKLIKIYVTDRTIGMDSDDFSSDQLEAFAYGIDDDLKFDLMSHCEEDDTSSSTEHDVESDPFLKAMTILEDAGYQWELNGDNVWQVWKE